MGQVTYNCQHCSTVSASSEQICSFCGNRFQPPSTPIYSEGEPFPKQLALQKIQPRSRFFFICIPLGLVPLLLYSVASLIMIGEGRCQPHTWSDQLAFLSFVLWGVEITLGILCLFHKRIHSLANTLLITLMLSLPLGFVVAYVDLSTLFCLHSIF